MSKRVVHLIRMMQTPAYSEQQSSPEGRSVFTFFAVYVKYCKSKTAFTSQTCLSYTVLMIYFTGGPAVFLWR